MGDRRSILMVAGEASGDLHASKVVSRLRMADPSLDIYGVGGERMRSAGMELTHRADEFAVVGLVEVLRHLPRLRGVMAELVSLARSRSTALAILVDYPGFNLVLARRLRDAGTRVLYYISPQVWAWGEGRVRKLAERAERVAVILPFEKRFFEERGVDVTFVGHPLLEEPAIGCFDGRRGPGPARPLLGLLPGSRPHEIERHLPAMLGAAAIVRTELPELEVEIACAQGLERRVLERHASRYPGLARVLEPGGTHRLMRTATALVVSSGTATLEAACFGTPMVIVYRVSPLSYLVGRMLVRIPHIGLVNVVAGEEVVPELVQGEVTASRVAHEVRRYLIDPDLASQTSARLLETRDRLGTPGASARVARMALSMMGDS